MDRRTFLAGSLAAGSRVHAAPNDRIQIGVIGLGGQGRAHVAEYLKQPGCRIAAICDIDQAHIAQAQKLIEAKQDGRPAAHQDLRRVLDDKNIDAVSIVTCNHWHSLATIWACQAGKDVYVEKPASHNIVEGQRMVKAARRYGRMVQNGMQAHSIAHYRRAIELLHQGAIGKLYMAKTLCYKRRRSIGRKPDSSVPPGVDYDLWTGPAEMKPFRENRFHYNWHWYWNTGNGDIGNQGVHEIDIARWGLGVTLPSRVFSTGGKFLYDDDQETPNTQIATFRYPSCQIVTEVRGLLTNTEGTIAEPPNFIGTIFYGSEGFLCLDAREFRTFLGEKREPGPSMAHAEPEEWDIGPNFTNFLKAVRSRNRAELNCEIETGYYSAALCHLANTSYRLGRSLVFDPQAANFGSDTEANRYLTREYRKPFLLPEIA